MEILKTDSSSKESVLPHAENRNIIPTGVSTTLAHIVDGADAFSIMPRSYYPVSWGVGTRVAITIWLLILLVPLSLTMLSVEAKEVPEEMMMMFLVTFVALCMYLLVLFMAAPSAVTRDSPSLFTVRVSPFLFKMFEIPIVNVRSVRLVVWRELMCLRFVGLPTDWSRTAVIVLKNGAPWGGIIA